LTGWAVHAVALHKQLAATKRDPLTGLLRRDAYTARARRLLARHGDDTALVVVDADHFKAVNDTMGHPAGDAVLTAFGARLTAWAGPHASVGRLGGDEFFSELTRVSRDQVTERSVGRHGAGERLRTVGVLVSFPC
jgi:diguanylate cyclase (GGDEF)-like protein